MGSSSLTTTQIDVIATTRVVLSSIALVTCTFVVIVIVLFRKYQFPSSRLILWLSVASALQTFSFYTPPKEEVPSLCYFEAIWTSFFDWSIALWICVIATNLFQVVVLQKSGSEIVSYEKWYHAFVWVISLIVALLPLSQSGVYGDSGAWCWIVGTQQAWRVGVWYGPLFFFFGYVIIMYFWILKRLYAPSDALQKEGEEEARNRKRAAVKLARYPLIFIVLWIFPIINRAQNWISDSDGVFWLVLMHTICTSLQGTINSIVYCIDEDIFLHCTPVAIFSAFRQFKSSDTKTLLPQQVVRPYELRSDEEEASDVEVMRGSGSPIPVRDHDSMTDLEDED
mmetsp:Transcript_16760/g.23310  ORF Transcript_16760/g.23310 Transcript_16760/m.23310 type:complete len:339 (-) Transcript_16760:43-1059(-)